MPGPGQHGRGGGLDRHVRPAARPAPRRRPRAGLFLVASPPHPHPRHRGAGGGAEGHGLRHLPAVQRQPAGPPVLSPHSRLGVFRRRVCLRLLPSDKAPVRHLPEVLRDLRPGGGELLLRGRSARQHRGGPGHGDARRGVLRGYPTPAPGPERRRGAGEAGNSLTAEIRETPPSGTPDGGASYGG